MEDVLITSPASSFTWMFYGITQANAFWGTCSWIILVTDTLDISPTSKESKTIKSF